MTKLPERVLADAFALSTARGAELLVRLGDFDVWRGDLPAMRGDEPRESEASSGDPRPRALDDTLVLARAIQLLPPRCRAALTAMYGRGGSKPGTAPDAVIDCEKRLFELYESLLSEAGASEVAAGTARRR